MGQIRCNMCCGKIFSTTEELICHIRQILSNIYCSRCSLKLSSFDELIEHYLSDKCQEVNTTTMDSVKQDVVEVNMPYSEVVPLNLAVHDLSSDVDSMEIIQDSNIEISQTVDNQLDVLHIFEQPSLDVSMETSSNVENMPSIVNQPVVDQDKVVVSFPDENGEVYTCTCGMSFSSPVDHIKIYHPEEEVLCKGICSQLCEDLDAPDQMLSIGEITAEELPQDYEVQPFLPIEELATNPEVEEPEVILCDRDNQNMDSVKAPVSSTITSVQMDQLDGKVEECVDKDGRIYIRKLVRVQKFWTEKDEIKAAQMLTKLKTFEPVRDVPVGNVSIKSKDEAVPDKLAGPPKKLYKCSTCKKTFQTMIHFRYHVCTLKNGPTSTCNLCGHESTSSKEVRAHWRMHQRQRRVAATALWELQSSEGISTNEKTQEEDTTNLQCERCGQMYKKSEELVHVAMHDEESPLHCNKCDESFDSKDRLSRHMRTHREQKAHICLYCNKSFNDSSAFKLHVRSHTGEKPFQCTYCGKMFSRPYERMKHERIHTGERPHVCEICGKTFRVSYCLTLHKRTHSGDRPYCCNTCGKRFKAHSAYKHHTQIHSEDRNYKCPYCPKAFKTMVHLAGHKKTHTKPFSCTECNRRFASLYSVKAHMESHKAGDNRFRYHCFVCGASYARAFALQYHMKSHGPSGAPEDVAEVLEIGEEDTQKKDQGISDMGEIFIDEKEEDEPSRE